MLSFLQSPSPRNISAGGATATCQSAPTQLALVADNSAAVAFAPAQNHAQGPRLILSQQQIAVLRELQGSLRENGIDAGVEDIGHGILEALSARPSLCRGLLAAYFLDV